MRRSVCFATQCHMLFATSSYLASVLYSSSRVSPSGIPQSLSSQYTLHFVSVIYFYDASCFLNLSIVCDILSTYKCFLSNDRSHSHFSMTTNADENAGSHRPFHDAPSTPNNTPFIPLPSPLHSGQSSPSAMSDIKQSPRHPSHLHQDSFKSIRREEDAINTTPQFFRNEYDNDIDIFDEPPQISVLDARMKDSWTKRFVEYDVQIRYKTYTWQVDLTKSAVYGLWFYVKKKPHLVHNLATFGSQSQLPYLSPAAQSGDRRRQKSHVHFPQLRKLFLAKSERCIQPDMVKLVEQYLNAVVRIPRLLHSSYVVALFQVSRSTFDQIDGKTSSREGWLRVRSWMKGYRENVRINRAVVNCDNECVNCICVVKRIHLNARKWRWVSLKHSCLAIYDSIQVHYPIGSKLP